LASLLVVIIFVVVIIIIVVVVDAHTCERERWRARRTRQLK